MSNFVAQMMTLHVFNPEHDLALAAHLANYTAPHAGRQLRADLGYIPALWAAETDVVLVENVADAERRFRILVRRPFNRFVTKEQLAQLALTRVEVWGWDLAIRAFLMRHGVSSQLMPTVTQIDTIRQLSHRQEALHLLAQLQGQGVVGEMVMADGLEAVKQQVDQWGKVVVKAPWSSSGRGVRFLDNRLTVQDEGWIQHVIQRQGHVMVEPHYAKVKDFGMEFSCDEQGQVSYLGLSLFHTSNGAYTGNILADEELKTEWISRYIPVDLLQSVQQMICHHLSDILKGAYIGPFGVDMMVVAREDQQGFWLHPCVEINLRRTMGHVALSLTSLVKGQPQVMAIDYHNIYKLRLQKLYLNNPIV